MALPNMQMRRMKKQNRSQPIAKTSMKAKPSVGEDAGGAVDGGVGVARMARSQLQMKIQVIPKPVPKPLLQMQMPI